MERKGIRNVVRRLTAVAMFAAFLPVPASAAGEPPVIRCIQTYGHEVPASACDPNPNQFPAPADYQGKVYPNSLLYASSPDGTLATGSIFVEGNATPGSTVFVTVSDGARTLGAFQMYANPDGNEGGPRAGDFFGEIMVSELGNHVATPGFDANTVGDDELGPDVLTVRAWAVNGDGVGPVTTDTIVKHAATHGDTYAPALSDLVFPPIDIDQTCKENTLAPVGREVNEVTDAAGLPRMYATTTCPYYPISGTIRDLDATTGGTASEVSDVRILVRKEALDETYLDIRHSTAVLPGGRGPILSRLASNFGRFNYLLNVQDLPANDLALVGLDDMYTITVIVCDAWGDVGSPNGNCATATQEDIIVHSQ